MGRHARSGRQRRGRVKIAAIAGAACLVAGGTAAAVTATRGGHSGSAETAAACPNGTIKVVVRADPSAIGWLGSLANRYAATHHRVDGKCVVPQVSSLENSDAGSAVRSNPYPGSGTPADVWVPDSISSLDVLRSQADNAAVLPKTANPVATSPLVLAAPQQTVTAWQRDGAGRDLDALLNLDSEGSAQISVPDPANTGTGLALILAAAGITNHGDAVTGATFNSTAARLGLIRLGSRISTIGDDGVSVLDRTASNASADHMVAVSEADLFRYNATHKAHQLQSFNAFGATRAVDYPYAILNSNWVTKEKRAGAEDFQKWLVNPSTQDSLTQFGLRRADGTAGGLSGPGIDGAHGKLDDGPDSDAVLAAHSAWALLNTRRSVLSLIDVSASMSAHVPGTTETKLQLARDSAIDALPYFASNDSIGLAEFSTGIDGTADNYRSLVSLGLAGQSGANGSRRAALSSAYQALQPQHGTALYDSILTAFNEASQKYLPSSVNMLIVLTDGDDANSTISLQTLLNKLRQTQDPAAPVRIITIAYGADANTTALKQIAAATGGTSFTASDPRKIGTVYISALSALDQ